MNGKFRFERLNTIRSAVQLVSGVGFILLVILTVAGWQSQTRMIESIERTTREFQDDASVISQFASAVAAELRAGTVFITRPDPDAEAQFAAAVRRARMIYEKLDRKSGRTPDEASLVAEIQNRLGIIEARYSTARRLVQLGRSPEAEAEAREVTGVAEEMLVEVDRLTSMQVKKIGVVSSRLQEETRRRAWIFALMLTVAAGLAILVVRQVLRTISRPVELLASHARQLSAGIFSTRTEPAPLPAEFRELAKTMNHAGESLRRLRLMQQALHESQKAETVGRLAGGIAHDFNNLLSAITLNVELLLGQLQPENAGIEKDLTEIKVATSKAANLTRQLLALSSRQVLKPVVFDLNSIVRGTEIILSRLAGPNIEIVMQLCPGNCMVSADPGQIEQVLVNLAVNARDAMEAGGRLVIETRRVDAAQQEELHLDAGSGAQIALSVTDTGSGIHADVLPHIFEPFYTTKPAGKGTGLGLAMVQGIVRQSGGQLGIESTPGRGSVFTITLPEADSPAIEALPLPISPPTGAGTILLAEDDDSIRALVRKVLQRNGYSVREARNGAEAVRIFEERPGEIQLILTDLMMPVMGGRELVSRLRPLLEQSDTAVLYMSGYTAEVDVLGGRLDGAGFLAKPFEMDALLHAVSEALHGHVGGRINS